MRSMVIAEKPAQGRMYEAAVGSRFGPIFPAQGHLFKLREPEKLNAEWVVWTPGLLRRGNEVYPVDLDERDKRGKDTGKKSRWDAICRAAKNVDRIYVATDPDREGEGIGGVIVRQLEKEFGRKFEVLRMLPLEEDPESLLKAFEDARPAAEFNGLFQSFMARLQADHIANLSLTRTASTTLVSPDQRGPGVVLSLGRVLTPTMGILCRREREIETFVPEDYFQPWVDVQGAAGRARLTHRPKDDDRIMDRGVAEALAARSKGWTGPIRVVEKRKRQAPPAFFSLSQLNVAASRTLGWKVGRTEAALQVLWDNELTTYPRSAETSLYESMADDAPAMLAGTLRLPFMAGTPLSWADQPPVIRRKKGAFSDAALKGAPHYAIVPRIKTVDEWGKRLAKLDPDAVALFEFIARRYLAGIGPDRIYDTTTLSVEIAGIEFKVSGTVEVEPGWKEVMARSVVPRDDEDGDEGTGDGGDAATNLPRFANGEPVREVGIGVNDLKTTCPPRFTDATLLIQMVEAWRYADDPAIRAALKETDGIGTVATQKEIIANLTGRSYMREVGRSGEVGATERAMQLYDLLLKVAPRLLDVGRTGEMELALDAVKRGEAGAMQVVEDMLAVTQNAIAAMVKADQRGEWVRAAIRAPSPKMLKAARDKARREGVRLPQEVERDNAALRRFMGWTDAEGNEIKQPPRQDQAPSPAQVAFAGRTARERGIVLPPEVLLSRAKIREWLDQNAATTGSATGSRSKGNTEGRKPAKATRSGTQRRRVATQRDNA